MRFLIPSQKKGRKKCFSALKIDMSKTYDRLEWNFLKAVLMSMKFSSKWVNWIMECVTTVNYTLLINGSTSKSFIPSRELRQGDPLSPYLFLMCANIISLSLLKAESLKEIKGVQLGRNGCSFRHLLFVDDSLLFFQNDRHSLSNIQKKCVLVLFHFWKKY